MLEVTELTLLEEHEEVHVEVTIIYKVRLKLLFSVMYTLPAESIPTGEVDEEYILPNESLSWKLIVQ